MHVVVMPDQNKNNAWVAEVLNHPVIYGKLNKKRMKIMRILKRFERFCLFADLPNLLIIERANDTNYNLITPKFAGRYDNRAPIILSTFDISSGFPQNTLLFPDKFVNLHQRIVRLAFCNYQPYSVWSEVVSHQLAP